MLLLASHTSNDLPFTAEIEVDMFLYNFKKLITHFLMPLPFLMLVFLLGLLLLFFTAQETTAMLLLCCCFLFLYLLSLSPISDRIIYKVERRYPAMMRVEKGIKYILILGGGVKITPQLPVNAQFEGVGLSRFIEGYRIFLANPDAMVVVSGGKIDKGPSAAELTEQLALLLNRSGVRSFFLHPLNSCTNVVLSYLY